MGLFMESLYTCVKDCGKKNLFTCLAFSFNFDYNETCTFYFFKGHLFVLKQVGFL